MRVEQALFTSACTRKVQGYHLVARSPGVDEDSSRILIRWGPSHAALADTRSDANSLNFHPVGQRHFALSRTLYGGCEYSARGGLQLFTSILVFRPEQLAGYDHDPLFLARVALALGLLRFQADAPEQLPAASLPNRSLAGPPPALPPGVRSGLLGELGRIVSGRGRAAVVGLDDPLPVLAELFRRTLPRRRTELSFTTGLKPSLHRPFGLHFLPEADIALRRQLASQGITVLDAAG